MSGPVAASVVPGDTTLTVDASHAGYAPRFGLVHHRHIALAVDGSRLEGLDRLTAAPGRSRESVPCAVHFHVHPAVDVRMGRRPGTVALTLPDGDRWEFAAHDAALSVESSAHHALETGSRRSLQIVLRRLAEAGSEVRWSLSRGNASTAPAKPQAVSTPVERRTLAEALATVSAAQ